MLARFLRPALGLVIAVVLAGCSGAGTGTEPPQGPLPAAAGRSFSVLNIVSSWARELYPTPVGYSTASEKLMIDGQEVLHVWGTYADGATYDQYSVANTSSRITTVWPGGRTLTQEMTLENTGGTHLLTGENLWSDGTFLTWRLETRDDSDRQTSVGTASEDRGKLMTYELTRQREAADELTAQLSDGSLLHLRCPTTASGGVLYRPNRSVGMTGDLTRGGLVELTFRLWGDSGWENWSTVDAAGYTGTFALQAGGRGSGTLKTTDGTTAGQLRWANATASTLTQLGAAVIEITPSAAAQRCLISRWVDAGAAVGPAPF